MTRATEAIQDTPFGPLLPQHLERLKNSAISPAVAKARGYHSVTTGAKLERLGFPAAQRRVPALLIPTRNIMGEIATYQIRPDEPRIRDGEPVKYETLAGSRMVLDVPLMARQWLGNPKKPLFITEGARKADAAVSKDLCCIALLGVWNWRGRNKDGGTVALPDWESVALNNREVYIVFDSDVMQKRAVYMALARLKAFLESRGAKVRIIYLPPGPGGTKVGLDDYLKTGPAIGLYQHFREMAEDTLRPAPDEGGDTSVQYEASPAGLIWLKRTKDGVVPTPLTNFTAEIVGDVAEDDGAEIRHTFEVRAQLGDRVSQFQVGADHFNSMRWPMEQLGARGIVYSGFGTADRAREAIQVLSTNVDERRIYTHIGWHKIDGTSVYLHASGAIGPEGPLASVQVRLSEMLSRFDLPTPPTGEDLVRVIRASLKVTEVGPDHVTLPLYAAMSRAAMATADFSVHIAGTTGAGKTALAALLEQHYGARMDPDNLPAFWSSTGNALEGLAFQAKDALLLVDDFSPQGSQGDVQRSHRDADRVLRAQGNRSGRQRLRPDGSLRPTRPPRGLILSTGEDAPKGQSLRARMLVLEMKKRDLDWSRMTACQADAGAGVYARALAGFVQWLARRYEQVQKDLRSEMTRRRETAPGSVTHRRIPTIIANLQVGLDYWLEYAQDSGALTKAEADTVWGRGLTALVQAAETQIQHQEASEPTQRFLELVSAAIASGRAHVASIAGGPPEPAEAWGWRWDAGSGPNEKRSQGERIGWVDGDNLYLEPDASYAVVQRLARDGGESITVGSKTLHKRLNEKGLLAAIDQRRQKLTVRHVLEGRRRAVLHLRADLISPTGKAQ